MHSGHYLETLDLNWEVLAAIDRHFINPFSAVRRSSQGPPPEGGLLQGD